MQPRKVNKTIVCWDCGHPDHYHRTENAAKNCVSWKKNVKRSHSKERQLAYKYMCSYVWFHYLSAAEASRCLGIPAQRVLEYGKVSVMYIYQHFEDMRPNGMRPWKVKDFGIDNKSELWKQKLIDLAELQEVGDLVKLYISDLGLSNKVVEASYDENIQQ